MGGMSQMVYAAELVGFVRRHTGAHFTIEVAAYPEMHPQAPDMIADVRFLKRKFDAGADSALTQFFYNADAYFRFIDACRAEGITQPVYPGIMPILNYQNLARFALDKPFARVIVGTQEFAFGTQNTLTQEQYVLTGDRVHLVPPVFAYGLPTRADSLATHMLLAEEDIPVRLELPGVTLAQKDSKWTRST